MIRRMWFVVALCSGVFGLELASRHAKRPCGLCRPVDAARSVNWCRSNGGWVELGSGIALFAVSLAVAMVLLLGVDVAGAQEDDPTTTTTEVVETTTTVDPVPSTTVPEPPAPEAPEPAPSSDDTHVLGSREAAQWLACLVAFAAGHLVTR